MLSLDRSLRIAHVLSRIALLAPLLATSCGSSVKVNHAPAAFLKQHQHVAVVDVKIDVVEEGLLHDALSMAHREITGKEASSSPGADLEEHSIATINRNLLEAGFMPVQRSRITSVLKEQHLQQGGLTSDTTRLGALLKADAVFQGTITVKKQAGIDIPLVVACLVPPLFLVRGGETEIIFSGAMTSVETGSIMLSGTGSNVADRFSIKEIDAVINDWFERVPRRN